MNTLINKVRSAMTKTAFARDERGLSTVEYVIILVLISVLGIVSWNKFGGAVKEKVESSTDNIQKLGGKNGEGTTGATE